MNKSSALFLDKASLCPDDLDFSELEKVANWQWFDNVNAFEVKHCLEATEIIVTNKAVIDADVIDSSPQLKLICVAATGVNNVDVEKAKQCDIAVCNVRAYATSSVVQHVFSLILSLNGKLSSYRKSVTQGRWSRSEFFCHFEEPISELEGKTIGIVGYGELGRAVAKMAGCFGMHVLIAQSNKANDDSLEQRVPLTGLLAASDVVSLHCPLTEDNRHMIAVDEFSIMKTDAILINTARGGLVDEQALLSALKDQQIKAAGLDVLEEEPPSVHHPLINYHAENLIITPHVAWASQQSRQRLVVELAQNIRAYQKGLARNVV